MSVVSPAIAAAAPPTRSDRIGRGIAIALALYLSLATWPVWLFVRASGETVPLLAHLAILGYTLLLLAAPVRARRAPLDWLVLTIGPVMYVEMRWIIAGVGMPHRDAWAVAWERALFPSDPSATLAPRFPSLALSEALHLAYAAYYLLVYLPPIALYLRGRRDAFMETMLALTIVYGACFITYAVLPVDGPRYLVGPAGAPVGPVRAFVLALLEQGSSRGTAFPSSHVAASVVASLCALQHQRRVGVVVAIVTAALTIATVYGGFHYAVDAVVGVILGGFCWSASVGVLKRLGSRGAQNVTPGW